MQLFVNCSVRVFNIYGWLFSGHIDTSPAFTFSPADLSSFFTKVNQISQGRYAKTFPHMFARYIPNILPPMCESDIPAHINDVAILQQHLRASGYNDGHPTGIKRRVDDWLSVFGGETIGDDKSVFSLKFITMYVDICIYIYLYKNCLIYHLLYC